ncbi:HNH endonuclease signature motif containing protein [Mycobacterium sp.]|uniref:HNH endonuclease signature motif containing protein n=1 Tax=Mycobacterium sp. TaxID=1785 RepID=UPI003F9A60DA
MRSDRDSIVEAFDALDAAVCRVCELSFDALTTPERLNLLERLEVVARRLPVPGHALINQLAEQADESELGNRLPRALADRLRITRGEAARRVAEAADLGERRALTGEVLPPVLTATAQAQRAGRIGGAHVQVIRGFLHRLPSFVDIETREKAEAHLAKLAIGFRPDQQARLADRLTDCLNPDGEFSDEDRARRRALTMTKQDVDGMSRLSGWVTPELRATLEAIWAKLAAPGMCNPEEQTPVIDGAASEDAVRRDTRSHAQRNHDGLNAALRAVLASGELGQHNGLPATIIVSTTLEELEAASGKALTGGRTLLPMSDVIRLAGHAHHYLAIFDKGKPIALYHTKRLASPGQRIVLYAKDRGCTRPGCDVPGYWSEVHHVDEWATTHSTDVNKLTLACTPDHKLLEKGWKTRKGANGDTEWIPPPHLDHGQPRTNSYPHPEKLLRESDDEGDP